MSSLEFFSNDINGWIHIQIGELYELLKENNLLTNDTLYFFDKSNILNIQREDNKLNLLEGISIVNYIEFKIKVIYIIKINPSTQKLFIEGYEENFSQSNKIIWAKGKIISIDKEKQIFFIEHNNSIFVIDNLNELRLLTEIKNEKTFCLKIVNDISKIIIDEIVSEKKDLSYYYNEENKEFIFVSEKNYCLFINELLQIKKDEKEQIEKYEKEIEIESNNIKEMTKISKKNFKEILIYNYKFKDYIEELIKDVSKVEYSIFQSEQNENDFKIILYSNNKEELEEIKKDLTYYTEIIHTDFGVNETEIDEMIKKIKINYSIIDKNNIYLMDKDENKIINFKKVFNISSFYSKKIAKETKENENVKKELNLFMKKITNKKK
jgi:hypothetical protein